MLFNSKDSYGAIAKVFHWVMALIILGLVFVGLYMVTLPYTPQKVEIYVLHKSFGFLVLFLVLARLFWRFINIKPSPHDNHKKWEVVLAKLAHVFLYVAMIGMPLSGWLMSSAGEYPVPFFGLTMPDIVSKNPDLAKAMGAAHSVLAYMLIIAIGLHAMGAFKHYFIDRDTTLKRMILGPFVGFQAIALIILLGLFFAGYASFILPKFLKKEMATEVTEAQVSQSSETVSEFEKTGAWEIVSSESKINFTSSIYNKEFTGEFPNFEGEIVFDVDNMNEALVDIKIDLSKIESGDEERDQQMQGTEWFDTATYPVATFHADQFEKLSDNEFTVAGTLTIKDTSLPLKFPFQLDIEEGNGASEATMRAEFTLNRLEYGLGAQQWQSGDSVGLQVDVDVLVKAISK